MIVQEKYITSNGTELTHTYSDEGLNILQVETGIIYDEAYDIPNKYTYEEVEREEDIEETEETEETGENENE